MTNLTELRKLAEAAQDWEQRVSREIDDAFHGVGAIHPKIMAIIRAAEKAGAERMKERLIDYHDEQATMWEATTDNVAVVRWHQAQAAAIRNLTEEG